MSFQISYTSPTTSDVQADIRITSPLPSEEVPTFNYPKKERTLMQSTYSSGRSRVGFSPASTWTTPCTRSSQSGSLCSPGNQSQTDGVYIGFGDLEKTLERNSKLRKKLACLEEDMRATKKASELNKADTRKKQEKIQILQAELLKEQNERKVLETNYQQQRSELATETEKKKALESEKKNLSRCLSRTRTRLEASMKESTQAKSELSQEQLQKDRNFTQRKKEIQALKSSVETLDASYGKSTHASRSRSRCSAYSSRMRNLLVDELESLKSQFLASETKLSSMEIERKSLLEKLESSETSKAEAEESVACVRDAYEQVSSRNTEVETEFGNTKLTGKKEGQRS
eukprot:GHVP01059737.1.p1 GENE.GHVP01059737.1~~GHVP01059737.1.p1  ORF type:complete len:344 (+),score=79.32 GHVP01059737.1:241-1272(+)